MYKMYIVVSMEAVQKMNGVRGKMHTQAGHAILGSYWDAEKRFPEDAKAYKEGKHVKKITVKVQTEDDLVKLMNAYKDKCGVSLIKDAGFTVFEEPTVTYLGIGPIHEDVIGDDLKNLRLFK